MAINTTYTLILFPILLARHSWTQCQPGDHGIPAAALKLAAGMIKAHHHSDAFLKETTDYVKRFTLHTEAWAGVGFICLARVPCCVVWINPVGEEGTNEPWWGFTFKSAYFVAPGNYSETMKNVPTSWWIVQFHLVVGSCCPLFKRNSLGSAKDPYQIWLRQCPWELLGMSILSMSVSLSLSIVLF